jgi:hypothetical protein
MINTITLVQIYQDFCKQGTLPFRATPEGFIKLMCGSFMMPVFIAYVVKQGYSLDKIEEWEQQIFDEGVAETFFLEVEQAFKHLEDLI